jgi:hypothetical protein
MAVILFVTAVVALLVGLVAGLPLWLWKTARQRDPPMHGRRAGRTRRF